MKKKTDNTNPNLTKIIFKTIGKVSGLILFVLGFIIVSMAIITPKFSLDVYDAVGMDRAGYLVQKRLYVRDPSNINLYNLIQRAVENENFEDQAKYIKIMLESDDYVKFATEVDKSTKAVLGEKYSIYADSYDSYLRRHYVTALYNTNRKMEAKMLAIDSAYGGFDLEELYTYINLIIMDEELIEYQKKAELEVLHKRYGILSAINSKYIVYDEELEFSETSYQSVVILNQKIKLAEIQIALGEYAGDELLEEEAKSNKEIWLSEINELKNSL